MGSIIHSLIDHGVDSKVIYNYNDLLYEFDYLLNGELPYSE